MSETTWRTGNLCTSLISTLKLSTGTLNPSETYGSHWKHFDVVDLHSKFANLHHRPSVLSIFAINCYYAPSSLICTIVFNLQHHRFYMGPIYGKNAPRTSPDFCLRIHHRCHIRRRIHIHEHNHSLFLLIWSCVWYVVMIFGFYFSFKCIYGLDGFMWSVFRWQR